MHAHFKGHVSPEVHVLPRFADDRVILLISFVGDPDFTTIKIPKIMVDVFLDLVYEAGWLLRPCQPI